MAKADSDIVALAREIVAGSRSLSPEALFDLAARLQEQNNIGDARRIYTIAQTSLDASMSDSAGEHAAAAVDLRNRIAIKLALSTYKDPDLPVDDRLKRAEAMLCDLLSRSASLSRAQHQESLGALGAVYKQRWSFYGRKDHLEQALLHYRTGYELGIATDLGYTAVNTAFVLDLLGDDEGGGADAPGSHPSEAARIRSEIIAILPALARLDRSLEDRWWFDCTLGEAYLGLRRYDEARLSMQKAAALKPDNWRLESTARQIAHIVRMQAKQDGLPLDRMRETPGFAALHDLLEGNSEAATSFFLGKVGLALSGGGFRASLYHIGVLARLAELDMLRHIEVISSVSGGSIVGAYYYLELRNLLQTKLDSEITRDDYIAIVKNVESGFLEGVQRNLRMRMALEPGSNWKVLTSRDSTMTDRLADLYERELYSRVRDEKHGARERYIQELLVSPAGTAPGKRFDPRYENWQRLNKVPILILNATTLNTCHNWQFTATFMGEPPARGIDSQIDGNDRLRRTYYRDAPPRYRRIRLGRAVAASACVPGLFDPLVLDELYEQGYATKLVDGGVYDNQGAASLREQDCTVLLVSDASGQTGINKRPSGDRIGVSMRANNVLMARFRQEQYQLLMALTDAGVLRGVAYVHLKKDLDAEPVDSLGCPDPSTPEKKSVLTTYGIRKDVQSRLARIRTDLDCFSDTEADALMLSGYRMMAEVFQRRIKGFPIQPPTNVEWRFRSIERIASSPTPGPEVDALNTALSVAQFQAFRALRLSAGLKAAALALCVLGAYGLFHAARVVSPYQIRVGGLIGVMAVAALIAAAAKLLLHRVFRNPNPLWQIMAAIPLLALGQPLLAILTGLVDPIYLRSGPRYRDRSPAERN